jgi:anti-sigma factor RsiW
MMACKDYYESLMLDVMGEPDPETRNHWENHLDGCGACRSERKRLMTLLEEMRKRANPPELPETEVERFSQRISWTLTNEKIQAGLKQPPRTTVLRRIPAMAALSLLLAFGAVLWYRAGDRFFQPGQTDEQRAEMALPKQDLDVIKNLDMLKDMETIQTLVQTIDQPNNTSKDSPMFDPDTQGTLRSNGGGIHA